MTTLLNFNTTFLEIRQANIVSIVQLHDSFKRTNNVNIDSSFSHI